LAPLKNGLWNSSGHLWNMKSTNRCKMENNSFGKYKCACCGHFTLDEKPENTFQICAICFWEDDGVQLHNPDYEGGANTVSLNQAKANFKKLGASEVCFLKSVRPPTENEIDSPGNNIREISYCLVCGYDLAKIGLCVKRYELCPCCLFHYGVDDSNQKEIFYDYRIRWLSMHARKDFLSEIHIECPEDLIHQMENLKRIDPAAYFLPLLSQAYGSLTAIPVGLIRLLWK